MRTRYTRDAEDKLVKLADIYDYKDHGISNNDLSNDAVRVIRTLCDNGYKAYIVGGAVRDLLLKIKPKDFDIATNADPQKVRKLFHRSHIIGKRFKLVHVYGRSGFLEVTTFRSIHDELHKHKYGRLEEDVQRRDFSINALYYELHNQTIIDFVGGVEDIKKKKIANVLPLDSMFIEDPVRIIRCIKYACLLDFGIPRKIRKRILTDVHLLSSSSKSRLVEEFNKILLSANPAKIMANLYKFKIIKYILPSYSKKELGAKNIEELLAEFEKLTLSLSTKNKKDRAYFSKYLSIFIYSYLKKNAKLGNLQEDDSAFLEIYHEIKNSMKPLVFPNIEIERSLDLIYSKQNLSIPKNGVKGIKQRMYKERRRQAKLEQNT